MKVWCGIGFLDPPAWLDVARACDEFGYHGVLVSDHVVFPETVESPYPYSQDGAPLWDMASTPWLDPWVTIGAMAAITERLQFGTNVYVAPARHPLVVAKAVATASLLSNGRVAFGAGVGWMREEFVAVDQDFTTRGRRLDEMIEILRALWAGGYVEHHGRDYDFDPLTLALVPPGPVPIYIGGESEPALRRAARNDGWIGNLRTEEQGLADVAELQSYRADYGSQAGEDFEIMLTLLVPPDRDLFGRLEDAGVAGVVVGPWMPSADDADMSPTAVRARLEAFADQFVAVA